MSDFEKKPAGDLSRGDWVLIKGRLSHIFDVTPDRHGGARITTDRGHIGETPISSTLKVSRLKPGADVDAVAWRVHMASQAQQVRHLGAAQVAAELGLDRSTIRKSLRRHGLTSDRPFPQPAVYIGDTPGWASGQLPAIREWFGQPARGRRKAASEELVDGIMRAAEDFETSARSERSRRQEE